MNNTISFSLNAGKKKLDLIGFEEKENFEQSVIIFLSEEIYLKKQKDKEQENNEI